MCLGNNQFRSNPSNGKLQYTTPSLFEAVGLSVDDLSSTDWRTIEVQTVTSDSQGSNRYKCSPVSRCQIQYNRAYTPVLFEMNPPVAYFGANISYLLDPRSNSNLKTSSGLPFEEAKLGEYLVDFENFIDSSTVLSGYQKNQVVGRVGQVTSSIELEPSIKFKAGFAQKQTLQLTHCNVDQSECYQLKTLANIDSVSASQGYTSGGQLLTITGHGFTETTSISISGVTCDIISMTDTTVECVTGTASSASSTDPQPGSNGLRMKVYNGTQSKNQITMQDLSFYEQLSLTAESLQNQGTFFGRMMSGYFKAPKTGNYKFYLSCDDSCKLYLGTSSDPASKQLLLTKSKYSRFRDWYQESTQISDFINLVEGEYYYLEATHQQSSGGEHISIAVEIEQTDIEFHKNSMKEVQRLQINPENVREQTVITIDNPDEGSFNLYMFNSNNDKFGPYIIPSKATPTQLYNSLILYYNSQGGYITVALQMTDVDGLITTDYLLSVQNVYTITFMRQRSTPTASRFLFAGVETSSTASVVLPSMSPSSTPLSGSFRITCVNLDSTSNTTIEMDSKASPITIQYAINVACPLFRDKIDVWDGQKYNYYEDGRELYLRFVGIQQDPSQFTIASGVNTVLDGNSIQLDSSTPTPKSSNIFYQPIPHELLYTNEVTSSVTATVNGLNAVCSSLQCQYSYVVADSEITSFSYSGNTLSVTGNNLPTSILNIHIGRQNCDVQSSTTTSIECTTSGDLVSGTWFPQIRNEFGLVPIASGVSELQVGVSIDSYNPAANVNPNGGQEITISGSGFPLSKTSKDAMSILFSDSTTCDIISSSSSQIVCQTNKFSSPSFGTTITFVLTINAQMSANNDIAISSASSSVSSISPTTYSPVLKTLITITLSGYSGAYDVDDFSVQILSSTDSNHNKYLNVVAVDSSASTITVKYGGSYSDTYSLKVTSLSYGGFSTSGVTFVSKGEVTSFSPISGSVYGGTLITIIGQTFSTEATDNPVMIGTTLCAIVSTSETEIKCRTKPRLSGTAGSDTLTVFLKVSEEGVCSVSPCEFTWIDSGLPVLTSFSTEFDSATNQQHITFIGTGFDGEIDEQQVTIGGVEQTIVSKTDTTIVAAITNITSLSSTDIKLNTLSGAPSGYEQLSSTGILLTPSLVSITPSIGSQAGSIIIANIQGVGVNTANVNLETESGVAICTKVTVVSYGVVECVTQEISISSDTQIKVKVGGASYQCANSDNSQCMYSTSSTPPTVTSIALSSSDQSQLVFTGTDFPSSASYSSKVTYNGIDSTSVSLDSPTQVTATFEFGLPISSAALVPKLLFTFISTGTGDYAVNTQSVSNPLAISGSTPTVECSFAGGCELEIVSNGGLATSIKAGKAEIQVCGQKCEMDESSSTSTSTKCKIPALSTVYSNNNFKIAKSQCLMGDTTFSSNSARTAYLFDMDNTVGFTDTKSTCNFGMSFKSGFVGIVSEVKFFMNVFTKSLYVDSLQFQGSLDGVSYTTIFTVGDEIHEGWNYYDFNDATLKYQFYRFYGTKSGSCNIGEFSLTGVEAIQSSSSTQSCTSSLILDTQTLSLSATTVTYSGALTPSLNSISPRFGSVVGGTSITFTGTNFPTDINLYSVKIDNRDCSVTSVTATTLICTTSSRPGLYPNPSLSIIVTGYGNMVTQGLIFRYVSLWSDETTWGGDFAPIEGDTVWIPAGLNLLMDVDSTPKLNLVLVEGALIFPPHDSNEDHLRTFDATYVMVKGGYLEIGTEEFPYTSKLIITMHGDKTTPEMPIYGSKVIGVRDGVLEMHGVPRIPTWTNLQSTVNPGASQITLHTAVDWKAGETIVIAPTSYNPFEAEEVEILSVDRSNVDRPVLTLSRSLSYKHYAGVETYGSDTLEMRAEVALLTRNVVYRGDPETSAKNQFGAHIMLHSHGDESLTGKIEYIELSDCGQSFQLGRYPLHFHMIGAVSQSYIKGNSIHRTYNRAVTLHGIEQMRIVQNVAFDNMGHAFFVEDAAETKNILDGNIAMQTKRSWSLLTTDQTPASFWITHPDNIFRNNVAAGSERYGFWFDLQDHPTGPSFDINICPINAKLGEFNNNTAHSNGRYGLRIFHGMNPLTYPCKSSTYDSSNPSDPFAKNPLITATFTNFLSYKNVINGAIAERVGDVRFENFKVADNLVCGIEFSLTDLTADNKAQINNALVVGHSANADQETLERSQHGIITARSENFTVNNVRFYNFDLNEQAAIGTCSHCFHPAATDSGARTVTFSNLLFDSSVSMKVRYQFPYRAILKDKDGSLTGLGANTWATPYWKHNYQPECELNMAEYDGLLCNSTVQVRRITFDAYSPNIFEGMEMKILKYDDDLIDSMNTTTFENYLTLGESYSDVPFKPKKDPSNAWAMPYVTGHKYKVHWRSGLDWMKMRMTMSERWSVSDKDVYIVMNFTDIRAAIDMVTPAGNVSNATLLNVAKKDWESGHNVVYNDTETREIHIIANGVNYLKNPVTMNAYRCIGPCMSAINNTPIETNIRYWSNPNSWNTGKIPESGENVEIMPGWNMILDIEETPILKVLQINGRLTFQDEQDKPITLRAKHVYVRAGELIIGNSTHPYQSNAAIILYGLKNQSHIVYTNAIEAGNKLIANTGTVMMYGKKRGDKLTRLTKTAKPGDSQIYIEAGLSWKEGDKIGLAPTGVVFNNSDSAVIRSYNSSSGLTILDRKLTSEHYGSSKSTSSSYSGVDIRGEVFLLSRNIVIKGEDVESWGCQFVTSDFIEADGTERNGQTLIDNVEIYNCSQYDTTKAAIRFEGAMSSWSSVTNSAIYQGNGWGVYMVSSSNIQFNNNIVFSFMNLGVVLTTVNNITLNNNVIVDFKLRDMSALDMYVDPASGLAICGLTEGDVCKDLTVTNNIIAGALMIGVATPGYDCNSKNDKSFKNNVVHSVRGVGVAVFPQPWNNQHKECYEGSYISVYKVTEAGVFSFYKTKQVQMNNLVLIDNAYGTALNIGQEGDNLLTVIKDSAIYGESEANDCLYQNQCQRQPKFTGCINKRGMMISYMDDAGKPIFPKGASQFPLWKPKHEASWGGQSLVQNVNFANFKSNKTFCGMTQAIFHANEHGADYHPRVQIKNSRFTNVHNSAVAYMFSPPTSWANIDDCGLFPCTGPKNVLLNFYTHSFFGTVTPDNSRMNFQIMANNAHVANAVTGGCKFYSEWNSYYCENDNLGSLLFESTDDDVMDRTFSPMIVSNDITGFNNTLNSFMDHTWDGFYTGQKRQSRFPTLIETGLPYNVSYTGTPPSNQRFKLIADNGGSKIRIQYAKAGAYIIKDEKGNQIQSNNWDDQVKNVGLIKGAKCGENRYLGVDNVLEFYLTPSCQLQIAPIDMILTRIRLNWTLDAFYADGGATQFVNRLAASLKIHYSTIKVVQVYQGSVQIVFQLIDLNNDKAFLPAVKKSLNQGLKQNLFWLGAQVLEYQQNGGTTIKVTNTTATASTSSSQSSTSSSNIGLEDGNTTVVIITNSLTSNDTQSLVKNSESNSKMVMILAISLTVFFLFVITLVVAIVVYKKCYQKKLKDQENSNMPYQEQKMQTKGMEEVVDYVEKPQGIIGSIFKKRGTPSNIVVQNAESNHSEPVNNKGIDGSQWNTYLSIQQQNSTALENKNLMNANEDGKPRKVLYYPKNAMVHSELSIQSAREGEDHGASNMISPTRIGLMEIKDNVTVSEKRFQFQIEEEEKSKE